MRPPLAAVLAAVAVAACARAPSSQGAQAAPERLYRSKCSACHRAYPADHLTAGRWAEVVARMAPRAHLTEAERAEILGFLQANAKGGPDR